MPSSSNSAAWPGSPQFAMTQNGTGTDEWPKINKKTICDRVFVSLVQPTPSVCHWAPNAAGTGPRSTGSSTALGERFIQPGVARDVIRGGRRCVHRVFLVRRTCRGLDSGPLTTISVGALLTISYRGRAEMDRDLLRRRSRQARDQPTDETGRSEVPPRSPIRACVGRHASKARFASTPCRAPASARAERRLSG